MHDTDALTPVEIMDALAGLDIKIEITAVAKWTKAQRDQVVDWIADVMIARAGFEEMETTRPDWLPGPIK